jgi:hypothetical protein
MKTLNIVNCLLVLLIAFGIYYAFIHTGENYYYGPLLDEICESQDCSTPDGKKSAIDTCFDKIKKDARYSPKGCAESLDAKSRANTCFEDCDIETVPYYTINVGQSKSQLQCKEPLELGMDTSTGDQWCMNKNDVWSFYKSAKTLEAEKKAAEEAAKKAAEEAAKKAEAKEYYRYSF